MDWFRANSLTLNVQKTKYLLFTLLTKKGKINLKIGDCTIKPSSETKFLGVILDDKLEWTAHGSHFLTKMKQNLGLMKRGKSLLSKHGLKTLYYAHIYSHMSYCILIWGSMLNSTLLTKIRSQQNCCMRTLDKNISPPLSYNKYKILPIDKVIDLELCKLGYKLNHNMLPVSLLSSLKGDAVGKSMEKTHDYNTRYKLELNHPKATGKNYHRRFF